MEKYDLFYRAFPGFLKYILMHDGNRENAEDAYGQALYYAVRAVNNGIEIADWDAYLFIAARNAYAKMNQKGRNITLLNLEGTNLAMHQKIDPAAKADAFLDVHTIETCINRLSQKFKDVLVSTMQGYSDKEIEAQFKLAANSAKVIRNLARKEIKKLLGDAGFAFSLLLMALFL